jgi:hypothetical protein
MTIRTTTLDRDTLPPQRAARIVGAVYLIVNATAIFTDFFLRSKLIVSGDGVRTASNIAAHAPLFRLSIGLDLLTITGDVILAWALYELLAPVHRSLARLATMFRIAEVSVYGATTACYFVVLWILSDAAYLQAFEPRQIQALTRLLLNARTSGFWIAILFLCLGSTLTFYLLLRSRYVPKMIALQGLAASTLAVLYILANFLAPEWVEATFAAVQALPVAVLVLLAVVVVPIFTFELTLGVWLLVKGARVPDETWLAQPAGDSNHTGDTI